MPSDENQRKVFDFFVSHLDTQEAFTQQDLKAVVSWKGKTFGTYWSKQFKPLVIKTGGGKYRVSEAFRRYATWEKFQQHVTQVRRVDSTDYKRIEFNTVRIYEFFMPLTNEAILRTTLDALFYKDSVKARIRRIPSDKIRKVFCDNHGESEGAYIDRLCDWISKKFVGYSVYHVSGRFRVGGLVDRASAGSVPRYIIDETTAVTRFIFPCKDDEEAERVAFFFEELFVKAIIEVVNGEDEIWMAETGMCNRLHIWRVNDGT